MVTEFDSLWEFILLEEFKKCRISCMYLYEQWVNSLSSAAVLAEDCSPPRHHLFNHCPLAALKFFKTWTTKVLTLSFQ